MAKYRCIINVTYLCKEGALLIIEGTVVYVYDYQN